MYQLNIKCTIMWARSFILAQVQKSASKANCIKEREAFTYFRRLFVGLLQQSLAADSQSKDKQKFLTLLIIQISSKGQTTSIYHKLYLFLFFCISKVVTVVIFI